MDINKFRLKDKKSYLIASSEKFASTDDFLDAVAKKLEKGTQAIELRENCSSKIFLEHGMRIRELCSIYNALFFIHDRLDIAKLVKADGIHLPKNGFNIQTARDFIEENIIIGTTAETQNDIIDAETQKFDYIICTKISQKIPKIHSFSEIKKII